MGLKRPFGSPDHGCAGKTVAHLLFLSQTSAGLSTMLIVRYSCELSTHPRLVSATVVQHTPSNAGELVGESGRHDVVMHALGGGLQPPAEAVLGPVGRP